MNQHLANEAISTAFCQVFRISLLTKDFDTRWPWAVNPAVWHFYKGKSICMENIVFPQSNQGQALRLAQLGFAVYPVWGIGTDSKCLCGGLAGCHAGKHPYGKLVPHGEKDATTNADVIRSWFKGSAVNVGVSIGGFVVLDADHKSGGMETLAAWEVRHGPLPQTPTVATGGGGRHIYFKAAAGINLPNGKHIAAGVEYHHCGGLISPPSRHQSGGCYEWLIPPETPLAAMPEWLLAVCRSAEPTAFSPKKANPPTAEPQPFNPMRGTVATGDTFAALGSLSSGQRSEPLNRIIGSMLANGYSAEEVLAAGRQWADQQDPPYIDADLQQKVKWAIRKERSTGVGWLNDGCEDANCEDGSEVLTADQFFAKPTSEDAIRSSQFADQPTAGHGCRPAGHGYLPPAMAADLPAMAADLPTAEDAIRSSQFADQHTTNHTHPVGL